MMAWILYYVNRGIAFTRQFPKFVLVAVVFLGSTFWFMSWWKARHAKTPEAVAARQVQQLAAEKQLDDKITHRLARLFLAGSNLYDAETGEMIYPDWINGDQPSEIYYQMDQKRIIGRFESNVVRYDLEGHRESNLTQRHGLSVFRDLNRAVFPREGDLWLAEVDWTTFKLKNERQVTKLGNLQESNMLRNVALASERFMVLRNLNNLLRINMETGHVIPVSLPLGAVNRGRSPDGAMFLGAADDRAGNKVFAYDLEKDEAQFEAIGKAKVNDFTWISETTCLVLAGGATVLSYDRKENSFSPVCKLPVASQRLIGPSPDGRYIFATNGQAVMLIDTKEKLVEMFPQIGQNLEWISKDSLLITADVPASDFRGTWVKKIGSDPRRICPDPYNSARDGTTAVLVMPDAHWVIFGTRDRLFRMNTEGDELKELATLRRPVIRLQKLTEWPLKASAGN